MPTKTKKTAGTGDEEEVIPETQDNAEVIPETQDNAALIVKQAAKRSLTGAAIAHAHAKKKAKR